MCAHEVCTYSLLNLTIASSNNHSQAKSRSAKIRQWEHFWETLSVQHVCRYSAVKCCTSVCNTVCLKILFHKLFDFQKRDQFSISLGSTSLIHCDSRNILKRCTLLTISHALQQVHDTFKHIKVYVDLYLEGIESNWIHFVQNNILLNVKLNVCSFILLRPSSICATMDMQAP